MRARTFHDWRRFYARHGAPSVRSGGVTIIRPGVPYRSGELTFKRKIDADGRVTDGLIALDGEIAIFTGLCVPP
jgi:hypothetical protein